MLEKFKYIALEVYFADSDDLISLSTVILVSSHSRMYSEHDDIRFARSRQKTQRENQIVQWSSSVQRTVGSL